MFSTPGGTPASSASLADHQRRSGVISAGLTISVQPHASAGAIFHMPIISGKFQGTIAATTPTGSRTVIRKRIGARGHDLAVDLVAPAGVVGERIDGGGHVLALHGRDRLAGVQAFDGGELVLIFSQQLGKPHEDAAALGGAHRVPRLERGARDLHRAVDIRRRPWATPRSAPRSPD